MKKESMRKYSLLGLVLVAASAVTAAALPKNEENKQTGRLVASAGPDNPDQVTCTASPGSGAACDWTQTQAGDGVNGQGSRTTEDAGGTSSFTNTAGAKVSTDTGFDQHTSHN